MSGTCKYFKVINISVNVIGRGLSQRKHNVDVRVDKCKMISNKLKLE